MFLDEDQTKEGLKRNGEASAARSVLSKTRKRADAWELIWRSPDDGSGISKYHRWNAWLRENMEESTSGLAVTLARTHELLNDHRDELLLQCAQSRRLLESFLCRTWLVEGDVASFQPFAAARAQGKACNEAARGQRKHQMGQPFMSVFAAFINGLTTETLGSTGLEDV